MDPVEWDQLCHQQSLQVHGIHVPELPALLDGQHGQVYREFRLQFSRAGSSCDDVSMKLAAVSSDQTPYSYTAGGLHFQGAPLSWPGTRVYAVPIPPLESDWHYKGYTLPFRGSKNPNYELRLNLRITGHCPGRCFFCHRTHSHRLGSIARFTPGPREVLERLVNAEGMDVFRQIQRVMLICELFGREDTFLQVLSEAAAALADYGYPAERDFNSIAGEVRSLTGMQTLRRLVRPARYSFSFEFFHNRDQWMSCYKGLPLDQVITVLQNARRAGFTEIQLNYLAGIDTLEEARAGFTRLADLGLVDSVGLSTYTVFQSNLYSYRCQPAWEPEYYSELAGLFSQLRIRAYRPESYDMGCPFTALMEKTS